VISDGLGEAALIAPPLLSFLLPHNVSNPEHARAKRDPCCSGCLVAGDEKKYSDNANANRQDRHVIEFHDPLREAASRKPTEHGCYRMAADEAKAVVLDFVGPLRAGRKPCRLRSAGTVR